MKRYLLSIFILILSLGILIGCNDSVTEEIEEVRVKFIVDEEVYSSKKYEIGKKIKFPDIPYKEGYEFVGWYTNDDVELKEGIKATTKLTLYAKFEPIDETIELCTVNFYVGGKFFKSITVDVNSTIPSLPIPEIATGSEFNGWYTNDGTQFDQYTIVTESIDLFAKFEEEKTYYTVNFYDSIGGKLMYTERFEENSFVESIPKMEPPTGMVFVGWYDLDNEKYTVGMPITKDMDYHAIFVGMGEPTEYCTVNFYYGDVLVYSKKVEYGGELGEFELTPSPNENFLGWYTKGGMKYTEDILVYGDLDLYAKYEEVVEYCTLRYYYDLDFKLYDEIIVKKGSIIEFPVEPTKEGYVFTGWFIEDVTLAQEGLIVNCDLRLFARFIEELIFIFTYNEYDSCIEITGYIGNDEVVEIPSEINGKPVTEIASMAFENCTFKEIIIPDSVTTIGKHILYGCNNLEKLTTPFFENSSNILTNMFGGEIPTSAIFPPNLKEVTVTNMTDLTPYAFYNSGVEIINLPKNLVTIGNSAFDGCYNLKNITIPETVISIGIYAFSNTGLTYLHIPSSVEVLEENSIIFNYSLEELSICAKKVNSYAIQCASSLSILYIGNETVLADCAIYDTSYPNVVFTAQSEEDFAKNVSLGNNFSVETVIYDVSGTEFEYVAAENCSYYLSNTNKVYNFSFTPYWFGHNVHFLDEYVNGNELVSIANDAFGGCTGNGILIIPSTIKTIGSNITGYEDELSLSVYIEKENANDIIISQNNDFSSIYFYSEEEPTDFENYWHYIGSIPVIWPSYIPFKYNEYDTYIEITGYSGNEENVIIPEEINGKPVTHIGDCFAENFHNDYHMCAVHLPNSLEFISEGAFAVPSIIGPFMVSSLNEWLEIEFEDVTSNPMHMGHPVYFNGEYVSDIIIPSDVMKIKSFAFVDRQITSVNLSNVQSIAQYAFYNTNIIDLYIPKSVSSIDEGAFYMNTFLESITVDWENEYYQNGYICINSALPENANIIIDINTDTIILGCNNSYIPSGQYIGKYAFSGTVMDKIFIPSTVIGIDPLAFSPRENKITILTNDSDERILEIYTGVSGIFAIYPESYWTIYKGEIFTDCLKNEELYYSYFDEYYIIGIDRNQTDKNYVSLFLDFAEKVNIYIDVYNIEGCSENNPLYFVVDNTASSIYINSRFGLPHILFTSTEDDWKKIEIIDNSINESFVYFYSEERPDDNYSNYWHYDENDEPVVWS